MSLEVETILFIPLIAAALSLIAPGKTGALISTVCAALVLFFAAPVCYDAFTGTVTQYSFWYIDGLSALFLIITTVVWLMASLYSYRYIRTDIEEGAVNSKDERFYYMMLNLFVVAMFSAVVVSSVGILWIAIETTTLVSAFLVGFYNKESSTEAAWKYLMICSVGITLALVGIMLVYASSIHILGEDPGALDWINLYGAAAELDPTLLKMAFVFIIIGFGTKMGLVPMHTWLPDAHSQSPTPISAMLSAALLNCALYALLRFEMITEIAIPDFASYLMIGFGLLSLAVAAALIIISKDLKRMLAYSSIEHMGLIAIGFGIGSPLAVFGALFAIIAHSMTKPLVFFAAGNAIQAYGTREMSDIKGMRSKMPFTAFMLTAGALAIAGLPPFSVFVGEITILGGAVDSGMYAVAGLTAVLLVIVSAGFIRNIFLMMSGDSVKEAKDPKGISRAVPMILLLATTLLLGLFMPEQMNDALWSIADWFTGGIL